MNAVQIIEARARLADAWAGCLVEVDNAIFWIIIAQRHGEQPAAHYLRSYREHVRAVSEYQQQMDAQRIPYLCQKENAA